MSLNSRRLVRAGRLVALAAAVTAIAGAAVAGAAVQRKATTTVAPQTSGSATAKCRDGQVPLAAGFGAKGFDPSTGPLVRFASMPLGRSVETTGFNFSNTDTGELASFAYCGTRARPPRVGSKHVQVEPSSVGSAVARCGHGGVAIGGGFGTNRQLITLTSMRTGQRGWKVKGFNIADMTGQPAQLVAYVICKRPGPQLVARSTDATVSTGLKTSRVKCPRNGKVLSGGFDGHLSGAGEQLVAAGALTSKRTDQGHAWTTTALSASSPNPATITTYAYCRQ